MPTWAKVLIVVPFAFCIGCGALGYFVVWPRITSEASEGWLNVTDEMTEAVNRSVARRIRATDLTPNGANGRDTLILRAADINVNNADVPRQVGVEYSTNGPRVFGFETRITAAAIALTFHGFSYSAVPAVQKSRVELIWNDESFDEQFGVLFSLENFDRAIEDGINGALRDAGWLPVSLSLRSGLMTVEVEPIACLGGVGRIGGCDPATPTGGVPL